MPRARTHRNAMLVRLLALLRELDRRDGCELAELASRHQVATRTVRRDLDALQEAGVPLVAEDDGRRKRWRLALPDPRRRLAEAVDADHVLALRAAMGGAASRGSASFDTLADLAAKVCRALGARDRALLGAVERCFAVDDRRQVRAAGPDVLWPLMRAIALERRCRVEYAPPGRPPHALDVLPLTLLRDGDATYALVADLALASDDGDDDGGGDGDLDDPLRTLALHRIRALEVTDAIARPPAGFDAARHVASLFDVHGSGRSLRYRLRFAAEVAPYIRERQWHPTQRLRGRPGGAVVLDFTCQESFQVTAWIASWRHHVTVLAPSTVRQELRALGEDLARRYA